MHCAPAAWEYHPVGRNRPGADRVAIAGRHAIRDHTMLRTSQVLCGLLALVWATTGISTATARSYLPATRTVSAAPQAPSPHIPLACQAYVEPAESEEDEQLDDHATCAPVLLLGQNQAGCLQYLSLPPLSIRARCRRSARHARAPPHFNI